MLGSFEVTLSFSASNICFLLGKSPPANKEGEVFPPFLAVKMLDLYKSKSLFQQGTEGVIENQESARN